MGRSTWGYVARTFRRQFEAPSARPAALLRPRHLTFKLISSQHLARTFNTFNRFGATQTFIYDGRPSLARKLLVHTERIINSDGRADTRTGRVILSRQSERGDLHGLSPGIDCGALVLFYRNSVYRPNAILSIKIQPPALNCALFTLFVVNSSAKTRLEYVGCVGSLKVEDICVFLESNFRCLGLFYCTVFQTVLSLLQLFLNISCFLDYNDIN